MGLSYDAQHYVTMADFDLAVVKVDCQTTKLPGLTIGRQ